MFTRKTLIKKSSKTWEARREKVLEIQNFEQMEFSLSQFSGKSICGKRGGLKNAYAQLKKADVITGLCPNSMIPCSDNTSPKNTYCYYSTAVYKEEKSEVCPITSMAF